MFPNNYIVIEGTHKNPNDIKTIDKTTEKIYGPFTESKANEFAKSLIQKNVDICVVELRWPKTHK